MAGTLSQPRVSKTGDKTLLSYELPHRVHTAKVYPIQSPNGSTVILYGHENGVKIVWRGGRPFKAQKEASAASQKPNGASNAVISLDDSDDEGASAKKFEDKPEFEDEEQELDPSKPYPQTLQTLELRLGTDVLHLAILTQSVMKADGPSWKPLEVLKHRIVFAAACADNSVRLVTLPLTPPSTTSKSRDEFRPDFTQANAGNGKWGETIVVLSGHQKPSAGISMTVDFAGNGKELATTDSKASPEPSFIVASHSREVTGRLLLYRVSIKSPKAHSEPFQSIYLSSPARSISFNSALTKPLSSQLLIAETTGVCRIYDYKLLIRSSDDSPESLVLEQGTWLLSLYAGFQNSKSSSDAPQPLETHTGFGRKSIVDARWISNGQAIIVLFNDGEWAIWDIEGVGPGSSQSLLSRQGIKGGSNSEFSLRGYLDGATKPRSTGPPQITSSKFAPMTPGTRKSVEPFSGRSPTGPVPGQISVTEVPSSSPTSPNEESILFWLGESYAVIPSISKYWATHSKSSGNLFNGPVGGRMIKLDIIDLHGERCSGVEQIPKSTTSSIGLSTDVLILAEHRFTILASGKPERQLQLVKESRALVEKSANGGELDILGIEDALVRMENGDGVKRKIFKT